MGGGIPTRRVVGRSLAVPVFDSFYFRSFGSLESFVLFVSLGGVVDFSRSLDVVPRIEIPVGLKHRRFSLALILVRSWGSARPSWSA